MWVNRRTPLCRAIYQTSWKLAAGHHTRSTWIKKPGAEFLEDEPGRSSMPRARDPGPIAVDVTNEFSEVPPPQWFESIPKPDHRAVILPLIGMLKPGQRKPSTSKAQTESANVRTKWL
jgi:hypothetical protein